VASVPEAIAPDDDDVTSPTVLAAQQHGARRGPLRTATQAVDALIQELDTPARGTLLASGKKAVPVPIAQSDTGAVTMVASEPQPDTGAVTMIGGAPQPEASVVTTIAPPPTRPSVPPAAAIAVAASASSGLPPARPRHPRSDTRAGHRSRRIVIAIVVVVAVGAGTSLALLGDHGTSAPPPPPADAAVDARPIDAPPPIDAAIDAPVDAATTVKVVITSTPSEATVLIDGNRLGKTPFETTLDRDANKHVLKLRRRGYASVKFDVSLDTDLERDVKLTKSDSADAP